jgi:hypothetical protein
MVSEEFRKLGTVGSVFVDTQLDVLGEGFIEFLKAFLVFGNFKEHFNALLYQVLADDLEDLVLLKNFTRNVQWQVLRVDNTLDEAEPFWDNVFTVIHDEHTSDVQLDVVSLLLLFELIEWSTSWKEKESLEFELTFDGEVLDSKVVFPVVSHGFVE